MTREQKIEWLNKATNEEVINQLEWAVKMIASDSIALQVQGNEDLVFIKAELLRRMVK